MPTSTKNEILVNYAKDLHYPIIKNAADVVDYANVIGAAVATEIGGAVAMQAIPAGIAAIKAGTATGLLATILTDLGVATAGGAVTGVSGSAMLAALGGPVGIALGLGALAYGVYTLTKLTDDNIDDLIERLGDLDPKDEHAETKIQEWVDALTSFKPYFALPKTTTDLQERAKQNKEKLDGLSYVVAYLKQMQTEWQSLAARLSDWGRDPAQAKNALDKTTATIQSQLAQMAQQVKEQAKQLFSKLEEETGKSYSILANNTVSMYNALVKSYGSVTFDTPSEQTGFDLANKIIKNEAGIDDINTNGQHMISLHNAMKSAMPKEKAAPKAAVSFVNHPLSKRALTVGDKKITVQQQDGVAGKKTVRRNTEHAANIASIQKVINHLSAKYVENYARIGEDGIYGKMTAKAMTDLIENMPNLKDYIVKYVGVQPQFLADFQKVNADTDTINKLLSVLSNVLRKVVGNDLDKETEQQQSSSVQRNVSCPYGKRNPSAEEINACIMNMTVKEDDGTTTNLADWLTIQGYRTPEARESVIRAVVGTAMNGIPPFSEWQNQTHLIVQYVRSRQGNEQTGRGQLMHGAGLSIRDPNRLQKHAFVDLKDAVRQLWHPEKGPLENVFNLLSYATPFIPVVGWAVFMFEKFAYFTNLGSLADIGAFLDKKLGLHAGSDVTQSDLDKGASLLTDLLNEKLASCENDPLKKEAFFGGKLLAALIPKGFGIVMKVIFLLMAAIGVNKLSDVSKKVKESGGVAEMAKKELVPAVTNMVSKHMPNMQTDMLSSMLGPNILPDLTLGGK